jgi:hypothetical protein
VGKMKKIKFLSSLSIFLLFITFSFFLAYADDTQCIWTGVEKIVAIGDVHGDYDNFTTILIKTGIVSHELSWKSGKTHLVQTGDVMDRGPDAKKILELIMRLERESEKSGGRVHFLIGNHEEMNITGISLEQPGYVPPEQFVSFLPEEYRKEMEEKLKKNYDDPDPISEKIIMDYWNRLMNHNEKAKRKYIENFNKQYGNWILKHNAVIKINNIVFVHGGISKKFSKWELQEINDRARHELSVIQKAYLKNRPLNINLEIVFQSNGPFWYRELASQDENYFKPEVDVIFNNLDAKAMVIAHTPKTGITVSAENMSRFDKRVWVIDTGISKAYGGKLSALIIENGNFSVWGE